MKIKYKPLLNKIQTKFNAFKAKAISKTQEYIDLHIKYKNVLSENSSLKHAMADKNFEFDELSRKIDIISKKLMSLKIEEEFNPQYCYPKYRVCVDLDMRSIHQSLIHGNDTSFINYMGQTLGRNIAEEIKKINYVRY